MLPCWLLLLDWKIVCCFVDSVHGTVRHSYFDCACIPEPGVGDQAQMQAPAQAAFDNALALIKGAGKWSSSWWGGMLPQSTAAKAAMSAPDLVTGRYAKHSNSHISHTGMLNAVECWQILVLLQERRVSSCRSCSLLQYHDEVLDRGWSER